MATQTGNTYISGTTIDSIEILTANVGFFDEWRVERMCPQIIATTTDNRK